MKPNQGIVVNCGICGLTYVELWLDMDDTFTCPLCKGRINIGKGAKRS